jgi:YggT family protein
MNTFGNILADIIYFVGSAYIGIVLLRFLCQVVRADYYNPISKALVKLTNPLLVPLRKVIPGIGGIDWAALVLAFLLEIALIIVIKLLVQGSISLSFMLLPAALFELIDLTLNFYFYGMIILAIASFVAPQTYNPAINLLNQLIDPVLRPIRKILPPMSGLDFSPMVLMFGIYLIRKYFLPVLAGLLF